MQDVTECSHKIERWKPANGPDDAAERVLTWLTPTCVVLGKMAISVSSTKVERHWWTGTIARHRAPAGETGPRWVGRWVQETAFWEIVAPQQFITC
jgi:hypothetical protein